MELNGRDAQTPPRRREVTREVTQKMLADWSIRGYRHAELFLDRAQKRSTLGHPRCLEQ